MLLLCRQNICRTYYFSFIFEDFYLFIYFFHLLDSQWLYILVSWVYFTSKRSLRKTFPKKANDKNSVLYLHLYRYLFFRRFSPRISTGKYWFRKCFKLLKCLFFPSHLIAIEMKFRCFQLYSKAPGITWSIFIYFSSNGRGKLFLPTFCWRYFSYTVSCLSFGEYSKLLLRVFFFHTLAVKL